MGSLSSISLLEYLRSRTQIDVDTLDLDGEAPHRFYCVHRGLSNYRPADPRFSK